MDVLTEGRFVLGLGLGYRAAEFAAFGVSERHRVRIFLEKLEIVRRLLAGERVTARGDAYSLDAASISLRPTTARIPVWIAADGDRAVRRAARHADAWLVSPHVTGTTIQRQLALGRAARRDAGVLPSEELPIVREVCVAPTDEEAVATCRPFLEPKYRTYVEWGQDTALPGDDTIARRWTELIADRFVIGSPETCARQLDRLTRQTGRRSASRGCSGPGWHTRPPCGRSASWAGTSFRAWSDGSVATRRRRTGNPAAVALIRSALHAECGARVLRELRIDPVLVLQRRLQVARLQTHLDGEVPGLLRGRAARGRSCLGCRYRGCSEASRIDWAIAG